MAAKEQKIVMVWFFWWGGGEISFLESQRERLGYYTFFPLRDNDVAFWVLGFVNEKGEPVFVKISLKGRT